MRPWMTSAGAHSLTARDVRNDKTWVGLAGPDFAGNSDRLPRPQLLRGNARAIGKRLEFRPDDRRMHFLRAREGSKAAIGAGNDVLASDHARVAHKALGHQFGMFDQHGG